MLKILQASFNSAWTVNFQMFRLDLETAEEAEIKLPTSVGSLKKQENSRKNIYFCFIDYAKAFDCVDHNKLWKFFKRWEYQTTWPASLRDLYTGQEAIVRFGHGTTDWFQIGKGVCQSCVLSLCLFNLYEVKSCEIPGWMNHKLESGLLGEISVTSDTQMTPPLWQKGKRN